MHAASPPSLLGLEREFVAISVGGGASNFSVQDVIVLESWLWCWCCGGGGIGIGASSFSVHGGLVLWWWCDGGGGATAGVSNFSLRDVFVLY